MLSMYIVYAEACFALATLVWMQFKSGFDKCALLIVFTVVTITATVNFCQQLVESLGVYTAFDYFWSRIAEFKDYYQEHINYWPTPFEVLVVSATTFCTYKIIQCMREMPVFMRMGDGGSFVPEKMVVGSKFENNAIPPSFQCAVYGSEDGKTYYPLGQAFSVQQGIMTAAHVLLDCRHLRLSRGDVSIPLVLDRIRYIDADMALYKATQYEKSILKLSDAKLCMDAVVDGHSPMVQVVAFGQRSFGFLSNYKQFGFCGYGGSTVKGFSGAPYYVNKTVYGMHLGGDRTNLGYEASYIRSLLVPTKTIVRYQESSEDWLIDQASRLLEFEYDRSPYDPDEFRVRVGNRYHIVETDVLDKLLEVSKGKAKNRPRYEYESHPEPKPRVLPVSANYPFPPVPAEELPLAPRGALDFDQGNLRRAPSVDVGALGRGEVPRVAQTEKQRQLSQMSSPSQMPSESYHMESLTSMLAPPNAALGTTRPSRKRKNANVRYRQLREDYELLKRAYALIQSGAQTSVGTETRMQPSTGSSLE